MMHGPIKIKFKTVEVYSHSIKEIHVCKKGHTLMANTYFCLKTLSKSLLASSPHSSRNRRQGASETRVVSVTPGHMTITLTPVLSKWYGNWNSHTAVLNILR